MKSVFLPKIDYDIAYEFLPKLLEQCPRCGKKEFVLDGVLIDVTRIDESSFLKLWFKSLGGEQTALPLLMVTCPTCGHTEFFNANVFKDLKLEVE